MLAVGGFFQTAIPMPPPAQAGTKAGLGDKADSAAQAVDKVGAAARRGRHHHHRGSGGYSAQTARQQPRQLAACHSLSLQSSIANAWRLQLQPQPCCVPASCLQALSDKEGLKQKLSSALGGESGKAAAEAAAAEAAPAAAAEAAPAAAAEAAPAAAAEAKA